MKQITSILLFFVVFNSTAQGIDILSTQSVYISSCYNNQVLSTGTGFVMQINNKYYLLTNWHIVTCRNFYAPGKPLFPPILKSPNNIKVQFGALQLGNFIEITIPIIGRLGTQQWIDIPYKDSATDVVAIPLSSNRKVKLYPVYADRRQIGDLDTLADLPNEAFIRPTTDVTIVGYPKGERSYLFFPIFKRGMVASEPNFNYNDWPAFLIDATTKPGMSGSPVYFVSNNGYLRRSGNSFTNVMGTSIQEFKGIYSAQNDGTGIGIVWRADFIIAYLRSVAK